MPLSPEERERRDRECRKRYYERNKELLKQRAKERAKAMKPGDSNYGIYKPGSNKRTSGIADSSRATLNKRRFFREMRIAKLALKLRLIEMGESFTAIGRCAASKKLW